MRTAVPLALAILLLIIAAASWTSPITPIPVELVIEKTPALNFGVIPYLPPEALREQLQPVLDYLALKLQRPVLLNVAADYRNLGRLLDLGKVDIAWFSHASFMQLHPGDTWEVLCRPEQDGKVVYQGLIITRTDQPYQTIADLRGTVFAYVDRYSGSGFLYPNLLFHRQGIDPLTFFRKVEFTRSHQSSIDGVLSGLFDAAAVYSINSIAKNPENLAKIRFLAATDPIPTDPLVVRKAVAPPTRELWRQTLIGMHLDPDGKRFMAALATSRGATRFVGEDDVQKLLKP
jgi:phosphonate transport system substrate-binding protein